MNALVEELKVRARVQRSAARRAGDAAAPRLRDGLHDASRAVGFAHCEHARAVLGGLARAGEDMGSFWHAPRTGIGPNLWFARHDEARAVLQQTPHGFLLPYRRQCFVVREHFIAALGLDPADPAWAAAGHDLVQAYGSAPWLALARPVRARWDTAMRSAFRPPAAQPHAGPPGARTPTPARS